MAWYQDRSFILALSILIQQHEGVPQYDIYIYIYIHVIRDQSLITVRRGGEGYKSKVLGGGSEVLPLPGTYTHRRPCPYKKIRGGGGEGSVAILKGGHENFPPFKRGGGGGGNFYPLLRGSNRFWTSNFPFCSSPPCDQ